MTRAHSMFLRLSGAALALGLTCIFAAQALGQAPQASDTPFVPDDYLNTTRRPVGDSIHFCGSSTSALQPFDRAVAEEIGRLLLLETEWLEIRYPFPAPPYDFQIALSEESLFTALNNRCDVFTGFAMNHLTFPTWLTVSEPYLVTRYVLATREGGAETLEAAEAGARIGTRVGTGADAIFAAYLGTIEEGRWRRIPYPDHRSLLRGLKGGTIEAAFVWEPALTLAAAGDDGPATWSLMTGGPSVPSASFGMVMLTRNTFLRELIDQAIAEMTASGKLTEITERHGF
ncbi:transporter substrate-binding domain-containing protein [Pelagibacterium sp. H642]|uniref:substrate-binding periplasmic protein n=1 Tax=Pelagibacterium sp. H642 TaxID=1881069 RepID=UPI0028163EC8|nr:transporter substrate-binding domain-containing protein [Pelagibacterium sp. H642]WMT91987.1 transporter substrate-binding domain-containing protein [Pelagibacterium sp. H642]